MRIVSLHAILLFLLIPELDCSDYSYHVFRAL